MSIEGDMTTFVTADTDVHAIIANRMYPVFANHDTVVPYITYRRVNTERLGSHSGAAGNCVRTTFLLSCWAQTYDGAIDLSKKVRIRMDYVKGTWTTSIVKSCIVRNEADNFVPSPELIEKQYYARDITVEISHNE